MSAMKRGSQGRFSLFKEINGIVWSVIVGIENAATTVFKKKCYLFFLGLNIRCLERICNEIKNMPVKLQ